MREIMPGVFVWSLLSEPHGYDFNGHLVRHPSGNVCVDPVAPDAETLQFLRREGIARIVVTNRNHVRGAAAVGDATRAPVAIHPADADYARGQGAAIDAELRAGERIGPFVVVGCPGKSPGEVVLHDPARRLLVVGDAVIGNPPGRLSLLREKVMDDPARLRASVRGLVALDVDAILVGDGASILEAAGARLRELVDGFPA
jgi:glyoxylase-like metal-dependent hydrolase (beta-lactamase superfamily II)